MVGQVRKTNLLKGLRGLFTQKRWLSLIRSSLWYFWLLGGSEGGPGVARWEMLYPRRVTGWDESERLII